VGYLCASFSLHRLSVLELGPIYAIDRQTSDRQTSDVIRQTKVSLNALGISFLDLGPMYATDRRQTRIIA